MIKNEINNIKKINNLKQIKKIINIKYITIKIKKIEFEYFIFLF